jgi:hypothetical protein
VTGAQPASALTELWKAFVAAAGELTEPTKAAHAEVTTRTGQKYGYAYLTLPQLSELVRATFAGHGLAFRQQLVVGPEGVAVTTSLVHQGGATWTTEPLVLRPVSWAPQDVGSASTYARRYQLAALVGLSGSDDDDAASQQPAPPRPAARSGRKAPAAEPDGRRPSDKQLRYLHTLLGQHGYSAREAALAWVSGELGRQVTTSSDLSADEVSTLLDTLKAAQPAERLDGPDPADPWASHPVAPIPGGQADQ